MHFTEIVPFRSVDKGTVQISTPTSQGELNGKLLLVVVVIAFINFNIILQNLTHPMNRISTGPIASLISGSLRMNLVLRAVCVTGYGLLMT